MIVIDRDDRPYCCPCPTPSRSTERRRPRARATTTRLADGIDEDEVPRAFAGGEVRVGGSGHVVGPGCRTRRATCTSETAERGDRDRGLINALKASSAIKRGPGGAVEAVEGSRHAFLVGQARKMAGWGWDPERIENELRTLDETVCVPPLGEAAEFGRMAEWAARNVAPDRPIAVRMLTKDARRRMRGWSR